MENFTPEMFESYPVWKWNESRDDCVPVLEVPPMQCGEAPLFVKATLIAADGTEFSGYLIGGRTFYAFGLFVADSEHVMNLSLPDMIETSLEEIRAQTAHKKLDLFPMSYRSDVRSVDGRKIEGVIRLKADG